MRRMLTIAMLLCMASIAFAQYPEITIRQMQEVPLDSLLVADTLSNPNTLRWTLQASPYYRDTVTVTAVVVIPAKVATFTQMGFTMLLADTGATPFPWGGVLVRVGAQTDTSQAILDGFFNFERGDVIRMTGRVDEFPSGNLNSVTQFVPIPGVAIELIGTAAVPAFAEKTVPDFYTGLFPNGKVRYSTGEAYEGVPVNLLTPLTVDARVNLTRGTFSVVDDAGNQITDYDASRYFTFGSPTDHPFGADSIWLQDYPVPG
jgi:hypothetical protein